MTATSKSPSTRLVLVTLCVTYGAFYFGRTNLAAAVPGIQAELGYSKQQIGLVLGALKLVYGIGQLVNGQLAERVSPRRMLAIGMFGSAALNLLFGAGEGLGFFVIVWALNGYFQSLGWTPCMRVAASWIPASRRGRAIGVLGTSYQIGAALTFILSGWAAARYGWRGALWVPSAVVVAGAIFMLLFLEESPRVPLEEAPGAPPRERLPLRETIWLTLSNPALWLLALSLAFLNACRFGFLDWGLSYLKEVQGHGVDKAAFNCAILPAGGILGALSTGYVTDRFFGGRRAPVMCVLLALLGVAALVYDAVARASYAGTVGLLVVIGFLIFGPQVLLVGTAPADLAKRGTAAAASGFVDFMGYMGAFAGDLVTGWAVDQSKTHGWRLAIFVWAGWAFASSACAALLWRRRAAARE